MGCWRGSRLGREVVAESTRLMRRTIRVMRQARTNGQRLRHVGQHTLRNDASARCQDLISTVNRSADWWQTRELGHQGPASRMTRKSKRQPSKNNVGHQEATQTPRFNHQERQGTKEKYQFKSGDDKSWVNASKNTKIPHS